MSIPLPFLVHLDQRSRWTIAITWRPSSVVCKLFIFQASSPKPLGRLEPNLAGMFLGWSSTKLLFFVPVGYSIWLPRPIICSDWLKFQRSSSLKLMNWLNPNWSLESPLPSFSFCMSIWNPRWPPLQDILLTHDYMGKYRNIFSETTELIEPKQYMDSPLQNNCFSFLWYSTWPPGPIMCSDWLKFQNSSSETNELTEPKLHRNDHWKVLYQVTGFFLCQSEIQDDHLCRT